MKALGKSVLYAKNFYLQQELRGIMDFARNHGWRLEIPQMYGLQGYIRNWHGAGLLTDTGWHTAELRQRGVKIVGMSMDTQLVKNAHAIVAPDNRRIGEIAAQYYLRRGYHNFAAITDAYGRDVAFAAEVQAAGFKVITISMPRYFRSTVVLKELATQLKHLPTPCGIFCNNDWEAVSVLNAAALAEIKIPDKIAVVGVGNEELLCTTAAPQLSSLETKLYLRGYRAAQELDRIMEGGESLTEPIFIQPGEMVVRESSDFLAVSNPQLRKIAEYLRKQAASPLQIHALVRRFQMSESKIYRLFREGIGLSPKDYLTELRLNLARTRLVDSDDTIGTIAAECGFPSPGALFELFRQHYGQTPTQWREENRGR